MGARKVTVLPVPTSVLEGLSAHTPRARAGLWSAAWVRGLLLLPPSFARARVLDPCVTGVLGQQAKDHLHLPEEKERKETLGEARKKGKHNC